ncbi:MAG: hypothetical protein ACOY45_01830 [Pseudomonadota bacterium]
MNDFLRVFAAATIGAAGASLARAAPTIGPVEIVLFGYPIPIWSALFGVLGVVLARRVSPPTPAEDHLGRQGRVALTILLTVGVLALIVSGERRPIVALGWSIGLGYSGLAFVDMVARAVSAGARIVIDAFAASIARAAGAWNQRKDTSND